MSLITVKFVLPTLKLNENIAIIGSSGSLLDVSLGKEIDSFTEVVRFNRAITCDYEEFVGSKTTLRVVNRHVALNKNLHSPEVHKEMVKNGLWLGQPSNFIKNLRDTKIMQYGASFTEEEIEENIHKSNDFFNFKYNALDTLNYIVNEKRFSVGVGFIKLCVYSGLVPHIYGFDLKNADRSHYWEKRSGPGDCHNVSAEQKMLQSLIKNKQVIYHDR